MSNYLTPKELAEELKVPLPTVYRWNHHGTGPIPIKVGKHVRYRRTDVEAWVQQHASGSAA